MKKELLFIFLTLCVLVGFGLASESIEFKNKIFDGNVTVNGNFSMNGTTNLMAANSSWTHYDYPVACPAGAVTEIGDSNICTDAWVELAGDTMTGALNITSYENNSDPLKVVSYSDTNSIYAGSFYDDSKGANTNYVQLAQGGNDGRHNAFFFRALHGAYTNYPVVSIYQGHGADDQAALYVSTDSASTSMAVEVVGNINMSRAGGVIFLESGGYLSSNSTCIILHSPSNTSTLEVCD